MDARDGRRSQLLAPTHVVFVRAEDVHATFRDALAAARADLPSALGLHSGPSKSADIGHVMVTGVHGPGRLVAVVIDGE
jgi:L-lactate dehydrogenase complex protein LldG